MRQLKQNGIPTASLFHACEVLPRSPRANALWGSSARPCLRDFTELRRPHPPDAFSGISDAKFRRSAMVTFLPHCLVISRSKKEKKPQVKYNQEFVHPLQDRFRATCRRKFSWPLRLFAGEMALPSPIARVRGATYQKNRVTHSAPYYHATCRYITRCSVIHQLSQVKNKLLGHLEGPRVLKK